ncbi:serine hydrolase [Kitasatospora sp. NPDC101235]|uniref:serine hydrolase n=1 Tax=Kitasatospora sp. NPDC101235 TaxID=3364101 RepID=UPI003813A657
MPPRHGPDAAVEPGRLRRPSEAVRRLPPARRGAEPARRAARPVSGPAAGGLWTTAADLAALAAELRRCYLGRERGLVATELVREMLTPQSARAYGWSTILDTTGGDLEFGHGGQAMTWMRVHSGRGLVMLSNAVTGRELIRHLIATELSGRTRLTGEWQRVIEEAVGRERGGTA